MTTNNFLLSFELSQDNDELDIHCDEEGLIRLKQALSNLQSSQHEHLMTPSWGGSELSEQAQSSGSSLLNKVTIHKW